MSFTYAGPWSMNRSKRRKVMAIVKGYSRDENGPLHTDLTDLLADLQLLSAEIGLDFADALRVAQTHAEIEMSKPAKNWLNRMRAQQ